MKLIIINPKILIFFPWIILSEIFLYPEYPVILGLILIISLLILFKWKGVQSIGRLTAVLFLINFTIEVAYSIYRIFYHGRRGLAIDYLNYRVVGYTCGQTLMQLVPIGIAYFIFTRISKLRSYAAPLAFIALGSIFVLAHLLNCVIHWKNGDLFQTIRYLKWVGVYIVSYGTGALLLLWIEQNWCLSRLIDLSVKFFVILAITSVYVLLPISEKYVPHIIWPYVHWRSKDRILSYYVNELKVEDSFEAFAKQLPHQKLKCYPEMIVLFSPLDSSISDRKYIFVKQGKVVLSIPKDQISDEILQQQGFDLTREDVWNPPYEEEKQWVHGVYIQEFPRHGWNY